MDDIYPLSFSSHHNSHHSTEAYEYYLELKRKLNYYYTHQLPPPISLLDEYQRQTKIYQDLVDHSSHYNPLDQVRYHNLELDHHELEPLHTILPTAHTDTPFIHNLYEDPHDNHFDEYHQLQHGLKIFLFLFYLVEIFGLILVFFKFEFSYIEIAFCNNYPDHSSEGFKSFISVESCMQPSYLSSSGIPVFGNGCTFRYICELGYIPIGGINTAIKCNNGYWSERALCIKQVKFFFRI